MRRLHTRILYALIAALFCFIVHVRVVIAQKDKKVETLEGDLLMLDYLFNGMERRYSEMASRCERQLNMAFTESHMHDEFFKAFSEKQQQKPVPFPPSED